eukprot:TRINITY_DN5175_c0_g3_i1.p1 TRINITY_DN5175_c0_g3~~TRINITY_DN5175_c0_g3_i1.p1  ORF type:complete len:1181 (-),score=95.87 TRINITY_DN5175_c0_g3_i1:120-3662(-)
MMLVQWRLLLGCVSVLHVVDVSIAYRLKTLEASDIQKVSKQSVLDRRGGGGGSSAALVREGTTDVNNIALASLTLSVAVCFICFLALKYWPGDSHHSSAANAQRGDEGRGIYIMQHGADGLCHQTTTGERPNEISTRRFTLLTWLPVSLYQQFQRPANIYIGVIGAITFFPRLSPYPWTSIVPFFGAMLAINALKDLWEEFARRRDDDKENCQQCWRFDFASRCLLQTPWYAVRPGDLIWTPRDNAFPADILLLSGAGGSNTYISMANLDGETAWKVRHAPSCATISSIEPHDKKERSICERSTVSSLSESSKPLDVNTAKAVAEEHARMLLEKGLVITVGAPEADLHALSGTLQVCGTSSESHFSSDSLMPRGCVLRHVAGALGVVLYVGRQTKSQLNCANDIQRKTSGLQRALDCVILPVVCCLVCFIVCAALMSKSKNPFYVSLFRYAVIFHQVVPPSLYLLQPFLRRALCYGMNCDTQMRVANRGEGAIARDEGIIEDLGQVEYAFTDKTGTLTQNEMRFARCCVADFDPGDFRTDDNRLSEGAQAVKDLLWSEKLGSAGGPLREDVLRLFLALALCHDVHVKMSEDGIMEYAGMFAEEVAFVQAASEVCITLCHRQRKESTDVLSIRMQGEYCDFAVLQVIPFSPERKRMSVVCQDLATGSFFCVTKGADSVMKPLIDFPSHQSDANRALDYARMGFRTMLVGHRDLPESSVTEWQAEVQAAKATVDREKSQELLSVAYARMESCMRWAGSVALEDRLQDFVPETLRSIMDASIKVWMLTGDQTETAVEIARTCGILSSNANMIEITRMTSQQVLLESLQRGREAVCKFPENVLVLDGLSLQLTFWDETSRSIFEALALDVRACVCCRLSPQQKASLIEMVRRCRPDAVTLAIGDGANDAPMLHAAHVGVCVRGKEGNEAVLASDYALSQFRFVAPLLFCHGRRAHWRVANLMCYFCYDHIALLMADFIYSYRSAYAGNNAYPELAVSAFNVISATPVLICLMLAITADYSDAYALAHPELYSEGRIRFQRFWRIWLQWMLLAAWHGSIGWLATDSIRGDNISSSKDNKDFWTASTISFTLAVATVMVRVIFMFPRVAAAGGRLTILVSAVLGFVCFPLVLLLLDQTRAQAQLHGIVSSSLRRSLSYFPILLISALPDVLLVMAHYLRQPATKNR